MKIPTTPELVAHAHLLAVAFGVVIEEDSTVQLHEALSYNGARFGRTNLVRMAPITDEATYAIVLHEMGHGLHPTGSVRTKDNVHDINLKILEEESAWEWAQRYALDWTVTMEHLKMQSLETYYSVRTVLLQHEALELLRRLLPQESFDEFMKRRT